MSIFSLGDMSDGFVNIDSHSDEELIKVLHNRGYECEYKPEILLEKKLNDIQKVAKEMLIETYGLVLKNHMPPYMWSSYKEKFRRLGVIEDVESLRTEIRERYSEYYM